MSLEFKKTKQSSNDKTKEIKMQIDRSLTKSKYLEEQEIFKFSSFSSGKRKVY